METLSEIEKLFVKRLLDRAEAKYKQFCINFPSHDGLFDMQKDIIDSLRRKLVGENTNG